MAPSSLFLLLFKLVAVSIRVSGASVVVGAAFTLSFFLLEALVAGRLGCSVMLAGMGAVTDSSMNTGSAFLAGEAVAGLSSVFFGDFFFFLLVTSVQSSLFFWGWA